MSYVLFNGNVLSPSEVSWEDCSRMRYGDGFFESILLFDNKMPLFEYHIQRINKSAKELGLVIPEMNWNQLIQNLTSKFSSVFRAKIRIHVWRKDGHLYAPDNSGEINYLIEYSELDKEPVAALENLRVQTTLKKDSSKFAHIKSMSALFYVMFKKELEKNNLSEGLIINKEDFLVEASSSNVFLFKDDKCFTPSLDSGAVDGVMRRFVMDNVEVDSALIHYDTIEEYDEIFITNAINLIQPVLNFNTKSLVQVETGKLITKIYKLLDI